MIDVKFVKKWAEQYPADYDRKYYDPYIYKARQGDIDSLRKLTEWKNVGRGPRPMKLWKNHEIAFNHFTKNIKLYLGPNGREQLRKDFSNRAPIWSIFWHHVLFDTPVFDVYTHMAYHWDETGVVLSKNKAAIRAPNHWLLFDQYCVWFDKNIDALRLYDVTITPREFDRALFRWGSAQNKK